MQNALKLLGELEAKIGPGSLMEPWLGSPRRERLASVLNRLSDIPVINVQLWPSYECAVTFADEQKAIWVSYSGHGFNIWSNFGGPEEAITPTSNVVLNDGEDVDSRSEVVQIVREYFKPALVEAA